MCTSSDELRIIENSDFEKDKKMMKEIAGKLPIELRSTALVKLNIQL